MKMRGGLPLPFGGGESGGSETSATRTAVREFLPILLILLAVDLSSDGIILGRFVIIPNLEYPVPGEIYVYAFLGAGAYAVTSLAFNPKQSIVETYRLTYRLVGALPLGAGIYVLSGIWLDPPETSVPVVGLVFLSGLYVRLTLRRLADVAERLYGAETGAGAEARQHRTEASENVRRGWRLLSTSQPTEAARRRALDGLERAEAIVDDSDATGQELARARDLSEQAMNALREETADEPENAMAEPSTSGDVHTSLTGESG